jgi:hypothetical protein
MTTTTVRRSAILLAALFALTAGILFVSTSRASAAYLYVSECKSAGTGHPSGNDNDVGSRVPAGGWFNWGLTYRLNANYIRIDFHTYYQNGVYRGTYQLVCVDWNQTGQLSSSEDWIY